MMLYLKCTFETAAVNNLSGLFSSVLEDKRLLQVRVERLKNIAVKS